MEELSGAAHCEPRPDAKTRLHELDPQPWRGFCLHSAANPHNLIVSLQETSAGQAEHFLNIVSNQQQSS